MKNRIFNGSFNVAAPTPLNSESPSFGEMRHIFITVNSAIAIVHEKAASFRFDKYKELSQEKKVEFQLVLIDVVKPCKHKAAEIL